MDSRKIWAVLAAGGAFAAASTAILRTLRGPPRPVDYFLAGAAGTFAGLIALFLVVVRMSHWAGLFYTRRRKTSTAPVRKSTLGI